MTLGLKKLYQGSPLAQAAPQMQSPIAATTGGSIAASSTRYYVVTAVVNGVETLPSPELSAATAAGTATNTITLYCQTIPGATAYNWYESATSGGTKARIGSTSVPTFTDTGAAGTGQNPPSTTTLVEGIASPGLYTPPGGKIALVRRMMVSNPTAVAGTLSLSHVTSGGTGGAANRILSGIPVGLDAVDGPINEPLFVALQAGDFLTGAVTVAGIVVTLFGIEF